MKDENEIYREARRRVEQKARFYKHLYTYAIVNGMLFLMSLFRGRMLFPLPVAFFWGIGLIFHYLKVFGIPGTGVLSREWEDQEVEKEMKRMKNRKSSKRDNDGLELKELRKNYDDSELV